jgi:quercetin dioxygenase-like cupin family protein
MARGRKAAQLEVPAGTALKRLHFPGLHAAAAVRQTPRVGPNIIGLRNQPKEKLVMKKFIPIVCISLSAFAIAKAQDPTKVDSAHFKVVLNNEHVRIMDVRIKPGEKTPMHSHPNHVVYSFTGGKTKFTLADGKTNTATLKAGQAVWHNAETHTVENVGKNETHALDIELKK